MNDIKFVEVEENMFVNIHLVSKVKFYKSPSGDPRALVWAQGATLEAKDQYLDNVKKMMKIK